MKLLVANRGEIAVRIIRAARELGVPTAAIHAASDREAPHVAAADEALPVSGYLSIEAVVEAARRCGATAVHPGYGFLSQNAAFVRACEAAGLVFLGPGAETMERLGNKRASRETAEAAGVPVIPGAGRADSIEEARAAADRLGYPILLKASGGGGGKGMRRVDSEADLPAAHEAAVREARGAFGDAALVAEKLVHPARHVEVQILGDGRDAVAVGERDCSLQRRFQKVIEEAPAPSLEPATRRGLAEAAVRLAKAAGYRSAGTVEFLVDEAGRHYFLEVNTRLQVEHPVTEACTGIDLVRAQIELGRGGPLPAPAEPRGHAIEARLNAEDPYRGFLPQAGRIRMLEWPQGPGLRVDAALREGLEITPDYDPLLAKLIAWGADREQARRRLVQALRETTLLGVVTNQRFLVEVLESAEFREGRSRTTTLESGAWPEPAVPEAVAAYAAAAPPAAREARGGDPFSPWGRR
jgi:acetyl/propionyl-CoA carboxylase alpha subunit